MPLEVRQGSSSQEILAYKMEHMVFVKLMLTMKATTTLTSDHSLQGSGSGSLRRMKVIVMMIMVQGRSRRVN